MATGSGAEDDTHSKNPDVDRASVKSLEETHQSWLLEPKAEKKKKEIDLGCMVCSRKLFLILFVTTIAASSIVGLSVLFWKMTPRKHHHPPPLDNYTIALKMALKFFDAQKCKAALARSCTHHLSPFGKMLTTLMDLFLCSMPRQSQPITWVSTASPS